MKKTTIVLHVIAQDVAIGRTVKGRVYVGEKNVFDHRYEVVGGYPMPPQEFYGRVSDGF